MNHHEPETARNIVRRDKGNNTRGYRPLARLCGDVRHGTDPARDTETRRCRVRANKGWVDDHCAVKRDEPSGIPMECRLQIPGGAGAEPKS
jgi:hypothetical protein